MSDESALIALLSSGLAQCGAVLDQQGGLLVGLFLMGLIGSASHCVGMCGPFVLSQVAARLESVPLAKMSEFRRLTGAALLPYHFGRATTYAALGALLAGLAGTLSALPALRWLSAALLIAAALMLLGFAVKSLKFSLMPAWAGALSGRAKPLFASPLGWRGYALGISLGFIPCGLLYGALAAAAASGSALAGAMGMLAFVAGTVPALLLTGIAGHYAGQRWRGIVQRYAPFLLLINAAFLGYLAWRALQ